MKFKTNLSILEIGEWDFAGCGYFLSQAINQNTDSTARSVRYHPSTLGFPTDIQAPTDAELVDLWKRADVVHIHDDYRKLPAGLQTKPTVITYHGSLYRATPKDYDDKAKAMGWIQTASTLDLTLLGPRWMPDTRPDLSQYVNRSPVFRACHAPTKRKVKGTSAVLQACRKTVDLDLIENVQWSEALTRKGQCWVTIDQFQLGYGCNAIEAWLMGQPVIGGGSDKILGAIWAQGEGIPLVVVKEDIDEIRSAIRLMQNPKNYAEMQERGHDYVNRFHSMPAVAAKALEYYHEAIETFYSRGMAYIPPPALPAQPARARLARGKRGHRAATSATADSGQIYLEYLGSSAGWVPFEVNGHKYKFSKLQPIQPVLLADANTFLAMRDIARRSRSEKRKRPGQLLFRRANA